MASFDASQRISPHEGHCHGDLSPIRHKELLAPGEGLDVAEEVVPAAAVQAGAVVPEFIEDFFHLESGEDVLDEHGRLDRALRDLEQLLRAHEHVIPQARFQIMLHFGQIQIDARIVHDAVMSIVEEIHREIEQAGRGGLAIHEDMFFRQVPTARADQQGCHLRVQTVLLAFRAGEFNGAAQRIAHVDLAVERAGPSGRMGVLEIGHVTIGAGIERVDDHFAVHGAGDLDAAIAQVLRHGQHLPLALADGFGFGKKTRQFTPVNGGLPAAALGEQLQSPRIELAVKFGKELQRFG